MFPSPRWLLAVLIVLGAGCRGAGDPEPGGAAPGEAAPPVTPTAPKAGPRAMSLDAVMRLVHFAFRRDGDAWSGGHTTYTARVDGAGLHVTPYAGGVARAPLSLRTTSIRRGGADLGGAAEAPSLEADASLSIRRGAVVEQLENTPDGVEQRWRFDARPAGRGDVVVTLAASGQEYAGRTDKGLHFADRRAGGGVRYGAATWVDAAGKKTPVGASFADGFITLTVPEEAVAGSAYPAVLDPAVGPELELDVPIWLPAPDTQIEPQVSYGNGNYLVVWQDARESPTAPRVVGARVTPAGLVLDPTGLLLASGYHPQVAWNGTNWLVLSGGSSTGITGTIVSPFGVPLTSLAVGTGSSLVGTPAGWGFSVASNGSDWAVVFSNGAKYASQIISGAGVPATPTLVFGSLPCPVAPPSNQSRVAWNGTEYLGAFSDCPGTVPNLHTFTISSTGAVSMTPIVAQSGNGPLAPFDMASNGTDWLITWIKTGTNQVYGSRVTAAHAIPDGNNGFLIGTATGLPTSVGAAYASGAYGVFWDGTPDLYGARVVVSGGAPVVETPVLLLGAEPGTHAAPRVGTNGTDFLLAFQDTRLTNGRNPTDVFFNRVRGTSPLAKLDGQSTLLSQSAPFQQKPSVAWNGSTWLAVWEDARAGDADVRGVRLDGTGTVLDPAGIAIAQLPSDQAAPSVASNGTDWLVAWQDARAGAGQDDIYGARVQASGAVQDPGGFAINTAANKQGNPVVASDGAGYLVAWESTTSTTNVVGSLVSAAGVVATPAGLTLGASNGTGPAAAFNGTSYLVAGATNNGVRATRVSPIGVVLDATPLAPTLGTADTRPGLASDGNNWLLAYDNGSSVRALRVAPSGATLTGTLNVANSSTTARAAWDGTQYWYTYQSTASNIDISARRIDAANTLKDAGPIAVANQPAPANEQRAAVARGPNGSALVVYQYFDWAAPYGALRVFARVLNDPPPPGSPCGTTADCGVGTCVDGFCCDTPCTGLCQACSAAKKGGGLDGVCGVVAAGADPDGDCADQGAASCGTNGACNGSGACQLYAAGTTCSAPICQSNAVTPKQCNGIGMCVVAAGGTACAPQACVNGACTTGCATAADCAPGNACIGGACKAPLANGTPCGAGSDCQSGQCVDGVCCNTACTGLCFACTQIKKGTGADGTCGVIVPGSDPDDECPDQGAGSCGSSGACNGAGACSLYPQGSACGAPTCQGGVVKVSSCDGGGNCVVQAGGQTCAPYACVAGACKTSCATAADCASGLVCVGGACTSTLPNGSACSTGAECTSGSCADGVCCNTVCAGQCVACSAAKKGQGASGTCGPIVAGADPDSECAQQSASSCGLTGQCDGAGSCQLYAAGTSCGASICQGNVAKAQGCDGGGNCVAQPGGQTCAPYACVAGACKTSCATAADCASGLVCVGGTCASPQPNGSACSTGQECTSGACADGVCCNTACAGQCVACSAAKKGQGASGTCGPIVAGADPDSECAQQSASSCGLTGQCDGAGSCQLYAAGTSCGASICQGNVAKAQTCDGGGVCAPAATGQDCAPYACSGGACVSPCATNAGCAAGYVCNQGVCQAPVANGGACSSSAVCQSGQCVDGVCCNTACAGLCVACSTAKKGQGADGVCGPVAAGGDPDGECADQGATSCGTNGSCDGAGACQLYPQGTSCGASVCQGSVVKGQICDGGGVCTTSSAGSDCAPYACVAGACKNPCAAAGDCLAGFFCAAGACQPLGAAGSPCATAVACQSGHCADGVCCDTDCTGACAACSAAKKGQGMDGTCGPALAGLDPHDDCVAQPASTCGTSGVCNGAGACALHDAGTTCAPASCAGDIATAASTCDGLGVCLAGATSPCPGGFACAGTACGTTCSGDAECAPGNACDPVAHTCGPPVDAGAPDAGDGGAGGMTSTGSTSTSTTTTGSTTSATGAGGAGGAGGATGSTGTAGAGGATGSTGTAGAGGMAGAGGATGSTTGGGKGRTDADGGCGCRVAGDAADPRAGLLAMATMALLGLRRRRRDPEAPRSAEER